MPARTKTPTQAGRVPETAEAIAKKFGPQMLQKLLDAGWQFTLDANAPKEAQTA